MSRYLNGLAAEDAAERWYLERGATPVAKRMRNDGGEIDLIVAEGDVLVFVEVKIRKSIDAAAVVIRAHCQGEIAWAAAVFLAETERSLDTDLRFDAALLDRHGHIEIIENAAPF